MKYQELIEDNPREWRCRIDWLYVLYTLEKKNNISLPETLNVTKACVSNWRKNLPSRKGGKQLLDLLEEESVIPYLVDICVEKL